MLLNMVVKLPHKWMNYRRVVKIIMLYSSRWMREMQFILCPTSSQFILLSAIYTAMFRYLNECLQHKN